MEWTHPFATEWHEHETTTALPELRVQPQLLPPFRVLLHNDDVNDFVNVIEAILKLTPLRPDAAVAVTIEAHESGISLLLMATKERAELYSEQFACYGLVVTSEPDE